MAGSSKLHGLPKLERLRQRREYLKVQRSGRKVHLGDLIAFVRPSACAAAADAFCRLGVTVSSKVGNAVVRNRVKRLLREAWRESKELFPSGHDVVLVAKRSAAEARYEEIVTQLGKLSKKMRISTRGHSS